MKRVVSLLFSLLLLLPVLPFSVTAAGNYTYTDSANGNTFSVGANWVQEDLSTDPMYKVKFTHIQEHGDCISYGSHDVWSQLSAHEQQTVPRGSYDHTMYTHQEIADYLSVKERFVQTITIAGKTFFRAEEVKSSFIFFEVSTTHFVHIHNGWLYLYSFNGNRYNSHYSDFRKLLSSSIFPEADSIPPIETTPGTTPTEATPAVTIPVETAPSTTAPVETAPPTTAPVETTPPTTLPIETTTPTTAPVETTPPTTLPIETTTPTTAPVETTAPDDDIYKRAKAAYEREDYQEAQALFSRIPTYLDSGDYLRLLRIRNYGGNIGIGVVYDFGKALTNEQKRDIDAAAKNFDFADTARVLLWNVDVATYFLYDNWYYTENSKVYLRWHTDSGGFYYTRSNVLSTAISNTVSIHDGYLRVDINTTNKLVFHITLIDPNTMELYCYEYDKTYTMTRS